MKIFVSAILTIFKLSIIFITVYAIFIVLFFIYDQTKDYRSIANLSKSVGLQSASDFFNSMEYRDIRLDNESVPDASLEVSRIETWARSCAAIERRTFGQADTSRYSNTDSTPTSINGIADFSTLLSRNAIKLEADSIFFRKFWQISSCILIFIGMITTILVGITSGTFFDGNKTPGKTLKVLTIIFPAIGTAATSVVSFYSPQAEWSSARSLSNSYHQLLEEIATTAITLPCKANDLEKVDAEAERAQKLIAWSQRLNTIRASAITESSPKKTDGKSHENSTVKQIEAKQEKDT